MRKTGPQFPPAPTSRAENDSRETSAPGKQYQFSCVDRLPFPALRRFSSSRFRRPGYGRPANRPTGRAANRPSSQRANRPNSHFGWRNNADLKYRNVQNWAIIPPAPAKCAGDASRKKFGPKIPISVQLRLVDSPFLRSDTLPVHDFASAALANQPTS